jgi:spermidine synthase
LVFGHADPLYGWMPMYPSGWWSWTFAAVDGPRYRGPKPERAAAVAARAGTVLNRCPFELFPSPQVYC